MSESRPSIHQPVLPAELLQALAPAAGGTIVDGTLGGGGHTRLLAEKVGKEGLVIGLDRDPAALAAAEASLLGLPVVLAQANFCDLPEVLESLSISQVQGILLDLGLSTDQLFDPQRGFSFDSQGPFDLRFDTERGEPAWRLLERLSEGHLADLIYAYGEERCSRRIARKLVEIRRETPLRTAAQVAAIVRRMVPKTKGLKIDPATRTFQAFRIAVNEELKSLEIALRRLPDCLAPGGSLAIISFHSLEDRRVKNAFREDSRLEVVTKRPIRPQEAETEQNRAARSAKLRVARRVAF